MTTYEVTIIEKEKTFTKTYEVKNIDELIVKVVTEFPGASFQASTVATETESA